MRAGSRLRVVNFHWDRGQLLEEGHTWSDELPPAGVVAHVGELPIPAHTRSPGSPTSAARSTTLQTRFLSSTPLRTSP